MKNLTPRECKVMQLMAQGLCNKEIARELGLSVGTVKLHVHNVFRKLGVSRYKIIMMGRLEGVK